MDKSFFILFHLFSFLYFFRASFRLLIPEFLITNNTLPSHLSHLKRICAFTTQKKYFAHQKQKGEGAGGGGGGGEEKQNPQGLKKR